MKRQFYKAGPWLFLLSVLWYLGGNYLMATLHAQSRALVVSRHPGLSTMKVGRHVVIHGTGLQNMPRTVRIELVQGRDIATIRNEYLNLTVQEQMRDGVLHITIKATQEEMSHNDFYGHMPTAFVIQLPASVEHIETDGAVSMEVLVRDVLNISDLNLTIADCTGDMRISNLNAKRLNLNSPCSTESKIKGADNTFDLAADLALDELRVTMGSGKLNYAAKQVPKQSWLKLGDAVVLTAKSEFLRQAHYEKLP